MVNCALGVRIERAIDPSLTELSSRLDKEYREEREEQRKWMTGLPARVFREKARKTESSPLPYKVGGQPALNLIASFQDVRDHKWHFDFREVIVMNGDLFYFFTSPSMIFENSNKVTRMFCLKKVIIDSLLSFN